VTYPSYVNAKKYARLAGVAYLVLAAAGIFGGFIAISSQVVPGDPVATAVNIAQAGQLFRLGLTAWVLTIVLHVVVAWALFVVMQPANSCLSILAACFRLIYVAIHGAGIAYLAQAQKLAGQDAGVFSVEQVAAFTSQALVTHKTAFEIALIFFGIHLILLAWLMFVSGYMPKLIAVLLVVSGAAYLINATAHLVMADYDTYAVMFIALVSIPAVVAELALTFWLLIVGVGKAYPQRVLAEATTADVNVTSRPCMLLIHPQAMDLSLLRAVCENVAHLCARHVDRDTAV